MTQPTQQNMILLLDNMKEFLLEKNKNYGDSALNPEQIFPVVSTKDIVNNHLNEKLSRIKHSDELRKNDVVDVVGYLVLLMVQKGWLEFEDILE